MKNTVAFLETELRQGMMAEVHLTQVHGSPGKGDGVLS